MSADENADTEVVIMKAKKEREDQFITALQHLLKVHSLISIIYKLQSDFSVSKFTCSLCSRMISPWTPIFASRSHRIFYRHTVLYWPR